MRGKSTENSNAYPPLHLVRPSQIACESCSLSCYQPAGDPGQGLPPTHPATRTSLQTHARGIGTSGPGGFRSVIRAPLRTGLAEAARPAEGGWRALFEAPFERSSGRGKLRSQAEAKLRAVNGALRLPAERGFQPGRDSKDCFDRLSTNGPGSFEEELFSWRR